jgi:rfaE bifunctional protein kinase chain/domain
VNDHAKVIAELAGRRVVVIGDVMLDTTVRGVVTRISPEAPVPILESPVTGYAPGGAANVALNIRALGGSPVIFGAVGLDAEGARLRRLLHQLDVEDGLVDDPLRPTTVKTRIVAQNQQIARVDRESREPLDARAVRTLRGRIGPALESADAVVISDYAKGVLVPALVRPALATATRLGVPVVVDPKRVEAPDYSGATVLTPNRRELAQLIGRDRVDTTDDEALVVTAGSLISTLSLEAVLITCGADGMILVRKSGDSAAIAAHTHEAYDSTGAGDTVAAALALALAAGASLDQAAHVASAAAGIAVTKAGTAAVSVDELLAAVGSSRRRRAPVLD